MPHAHATQRVVVTAGASGIGLAIARCFVTSGAHVAVCDVSEMALEHARTSDPAIAGYRADVASMADVRSFIASAIDRLGGIDVLVNNTGVGGPRGRVEAIDPGEWEACVHVNLNGAFHCIREVVPAMKAQQSGVIINIITSSVRTGLPNRTAYVASKAGMIGLTNNLARELGPDGIRCNAISPGLIDNPRGRALVERHAQDHAITIAAAEEQFLKYVSLRRWTQMSDVGEMAVFLASEKARMVSGQNVGVCGNAEWEE